MKVIITDVDSRKAFDVVNIIQRLYGYDCILCSRKDYNIQLPFIYGQSINKLRHSSYEVFEQDFSALLERYQNTKLVYLPVSEKPTRLLYQYLQSHKCDNLLYLLPQEADFNLTSDKILFQDFCEKSGFPVPYSYVEKDIPKILENFSPLIVKPRKGEGSVGILHINEKKDVSILENLNFKDFVVQEKLDNSKSVEGGFFLCKDGNVVNYYTHQRLRTFPPEGGVSVFSKSTSNESIIQIGKALLKKLNWNGVAMIEFLYDKSSGEWKIIELNPRIWGSILLSAFNNSNFLKDYLSLCMGQQVDQHNKPKNVYIRWIYPFEVLNLIKRNISFSDFVNAKRDVTCYINFTYSPFFRSLGYLLYFSFSITSIKRFKKKIS
jgi:hypothetical protein